MFVVTGATGNIGSRLVRELLAQSVPVRAFVRDKTRAKASLGDDVELDPEIDEALLPISA